MRARVRKRLRSTTAMERLSRLATKQKPMMPVALGLVQAVANAAARRARREMAGGGTSDIVCRLSTTTGPLHWGTRTRTAVIDVTLRTRFGSVHEESFA